MTEPAATADGLPFTELAARFGTPLYVYDGAVLARQFTRLRAALDHRIELFFSLKSNPNLSVFAFLHGLGARAEVSSRAELHTAFRAGAAPADTILLGPGKSEAEIEDAVTAGIAALVCESFEELALIDRVALRHGVVARVALRVNPAFTVKGAGLAMGGVPRQFGIDEAALLGCPADLATRYRGVRLIGVHVYLGSRIMSEQVIVENTARILDLAERLAERLDFPLELVDVGGGLGVAYFDGEQDLDPALLAEGLNPLVAGFAGRHPGTRLVMELGRYLAADAGTYLTTVRYTKESMGRRFAVADGGTNHHMAAVGIGSLVHRNFPIRLLNRSAADGERTGPWQLTGPLCTPNDLFGRNVELPELRPGDLIGVERSGAYGPTASPTGFLSHGYPAEVLVVDGTAHLVRRRETLAELMGHQLLYTEAAESSQLADGS